MRAKFPGRRGTLLAMAFMAGSFEASAQPASPVELITASSFRQMSQLLHRDGDAALVRTADAIDADFNDLYVLQLGHNATPPVFVGRLAEILTYAPRKFAVVRVKDAHVDELSGRMHQAGMACGVLLKLDGSAMSQLNAPTPNPRIPVTTRDARVERVVAEVQAENIRSSIHELSGIHTRFHSSSTGQRVAEHLAEKYDELKGVRTDVTVETYDHGRATPQRSLVVRIEGKDRAAETVILGSHLDSVNWQDWSSGARSPGADDNASGTATNLEIFRLLMKEGYRPERTLEIHAYAAEEIGLIGSQDIARSYRRAGKNVVAMLQHDMTAYKAAGEPDKIWLVTSNTNDGLNNQLGSLIDSYVHLPWAKKELTSGSSDHASWHRQGYAASFPFEDPANYNHHIHTSEDTLDNATAMTQAAGFAKLGLAYVYHFAGAQ